MGLPPKSGENGEPGLGEQVFRVRRHSQRFECERKRAAYSSYAGLASEHRRFQKNGGKTTLMRSHNFIVAAVFTEHTIQHTYDYEHTNKERDLSTFIIVIPPVEVGAFTFKFSCKSFTPTFKG